MSMCLVALLVLAILSLFSAKYRSWAKEALDCVTRRLTLRPCRTGFDEKVRATITSALMKRHMGLARFAQKNFEAISWLFTIVMFVSLAYTAYGLYNLATVGTCDPISGNCVFNPGGDPNRVVCVFEGYEPEKAVPTIGGFMDIESAAVNGGMPKAYFFGTTWCPHCTWEKPVFEEITNKFSDYVEVRKINIDKNPEQEDMVVFNHYSPEGYIPLIIIGGKYYHIGAGESLGEEGERAVLTAILCKITGSPVEACSKAGIPELIEKV